MWGREKRFDLISEPRIAAIYFGLMQSGYEYYSAGKAREDITLWEAWVKMPVAYDASYFAGARQVTTGIYPFTPRAAALEMASFYVDLQNGTYTDAEGCMRKIYVSGLIKERELPDFVAWMKDFPKALKNVMECEGFARYLKWEEQGLKQQLKVQRQKLQKYDDALTYFAKKYNPPASNAAVVYCPLKCTFATDYLTENETLYAIAGVLRLDAALHEYLHYMLKPFIAKHADAVTALRNILRLRIEGANPLDKSDQAKLSAFEEYAVRELFALVEDNKYKVELDKFLPSLLKTLM